MGVKKEKRFEETELHDHSCPKCNSFYMCVAPKCDMNAKELECPRCLRAESMRLQGGLAYFINGKHTAGGDVSRATEKELAHIKRVQQMVGLHQIARPPVHDCDLFEIIEKVAAREGHSDLTNGYYKRIIRDVVVEYIECVERA